MFHRTNLTLSARSLSHRLNLGTRSLAHSANVKNGGQNLRMRHAHHDVMRDGMVWYDVFPTGDVGCVIPPIPEFIFQQQPLPEQPGSPSGQPGVPVESVRVRLVTTKPADKAGTVGASRRAGTAGSKRCARRAAVTAAAATFATASAGK